MAEKNGGAAFARAATVATADMGVEDAAQDGMSLLDYFAGEALEVAHAEALATRANSMSSPTFHDDVAQRAYNMASAMLAEREKRNG